jgi:hypothetical protein
LRIQQLSTAIALILAAGAVQATGPSKIQPPGEPKRLERLEGALDGKQAGADSAPTWYRNIEIAGLIEVEASYLSPYEGDSESDIVLATAELGIRSQVNDWVEAGISFLYEQDETDLEVDTAYLTLGNADASPLFLTAGQVYVPFGVYETNLVSDPLTLDIGEARETALQLGFEQSGFSGSLYVFNGDNNVKSKDRIEGWGANLGFGQDSDDRSWSVGAGYINDLGDSDTLQDSINDNRVAGAELDPDLSIDQPIAPAAGRSTPPRTSAPSASSANICRRQTASTRPASTSRIAARAPRPGTSRPVTASRSWAANRWRRSPIRAHARR